MSHDYHSKNPRKICRRARPGDGGPGSAYREVWLIPVGHVWIYPGIANRGVGVVPPTPPLGERQRTQQNRLNQGFIQLNLR